jgi:hypothetical protein
VKKRCEKKALPVLQTARVDAVALQGVAKDETVENLNDPEEQNEVGKVAQPLPVG